MEVKRLLTDLRRIEKLQTRKFGGERSIFGAFIETMLSTNVHPIKGRDFEHEGKFNATLFSDEKERFELAARNREDYFHTFSRIVGAIKENNRRTREAYERKEMMEQQASSL
ncbi:hypothetical protein BGZ54_006112 [Gamsiella multidivaricata]|nr:hypothetical protein BGZ54_006112 [Gamsiella multidivaricata]